MQTRLRWLTALELEITHYKILTIGLRVVLRGHAGSHENGFQKSA